MPNTHSKQGRSWAKLSQVKAGDMLELDSDFGCQRGTVLIHEDEVGLYFLCAVGKHHLNGQADDGEHCIGIYAPINDNIVSQKID